MIDVNIKMPDGSMTRVRKVSPVPTKRGAARYEREIRQAVLARGLAREKEETKQVQKKEKPPKPPKPAGTPAAPTFATFFLETYATTNNRPSTVREKRRAPGRGLLDELGRLRLDQITTRHVEGFKARSKRDGVGPKTINEEVAILGYAEEIGELRQPPPKMRRLLDELALDGGAGRVVRRTPEALLHTMATKVAEQGPKRRSVAARSATPPCANTWARSSSQYTRASSSTSSSSTLRPVSLSTEPQGYPTAYPTAHVIEASTGHPGSDVSDRRAPFQYR
jgi:hypothetical protein